MQATFCIELDRSNETVYFISSLIAFTAGGVFVPFFGERQVAVACHCGDCLSSIVICFFDSLRFI